MLTVLPNFLSRFYYIHAGFQAEVVETPCSSILCPCHLETKGAMHMSPGLTAPGDSSFFSCFLELISFQGSERLFETGTVVSA